jgi:general secretion pathway protein D
VLVLTTSGFAAEPPLPPRDAPEIAFEVLVLAVAETVFDQAGVDFDPKTTLLSEAQLRALVEAVQADRRSNVMHAPKVTITDGQQAVVQSTEQRNFLTRLEAVSIKGEPALIPKEVPTEIGFKFAVGGRLAADGKTITARIKYTDAQVVGEPRLVPVVTYVPPVLKDGSKGQSVPFTQYLQVPRIETLTIEKQNLTIPTGGHAILAGPTRVKEMRQEFGPPVLSKIPYVNRMYKNVGIGRETTRTYLIVSPKVLDVAPEPMAQR